MTQYHDLDPFNHGTTTVEYEKIPDSESFRLVKVLKDGWGRSNANIFRLSAGAEKNSNNFRVETNNGIYLLKQSHINKPEDQNIINKTIAYLKENNVKTPTIIPSIEGTTFYIVDKELFCFYNFIEGDNFDGSQAELINVASEIARLHHTLSTIPYKNEIIRLNGSFICHNRKALERIIKVVKKRGERTEFDSYSLGILDEIDEQSRAIIDAKITNLPSQVVHYDLHPHNVLFDSESKGVMSLLDFDPLRYSQRARDVGFGMHRFARTCGAKTERKNDVGVDVRSRARLFLDTYVTKNRLTDEEIKLLSLVIQDEALRRTIGNLENHYLKNDTTWSFDLPKQVTTLREGKFFSF